VRKGLLTVSILGFLLLFSSLTAHKDFQERHIEISPEQDRYVLDDANPLTFSISADPHSAVCVEVTNDNERFSMIKLRTGKDFFSSYFGNGDIAGADITTDGEGNAQYPVPMDPLRDMMSGQTKLFYRAFIIDPQASSRERKKLNTLAESLEDSDWQKAPYLQVFSGAEEEEEADMLEAARVPYQKGQELYKQKKYEAALEEFLKAKEIVDRGNIEYWLSYTYLQLALERAKRALGHPTSSEKVKTEIKHIIDLLVPVLE
jgi:tetratricopeptide (TPR) repeat protein